MTRRRPDRLIIFRDVVGAWRWERLSPRFEVLATSGHGYASVNLCRADCLRVNAGPYLLSVEGSEHRKRLPTTTDTAIFDS